MSLSFLSRNRTVLLVSDEALYIYSATATGVDLVGEIDWDNADFERVVVQTISKKCGRRPVLILNDMVEQHYRKEKIVKIGAGFGDKSGMIKRKLNVAFPSYPVRAAFPLKEKIKKAEGQLAADIYIFAAVPNSTQFNQTMSVTSKSMASVAGFCLLPVESSDMLKMLSEKLSKDKKAGAAKWCVFIGQHRSGGLRQIVTKNGEIALTRMTPVGDANENHQKWAAEVHQEFKSTMSYLARFGFVPEDSLDAIVITGSEAGDVLNTIVAEDDISFHTMTAHEAAQLLNVRIGRQEEPHFSDTLHVAWSARKSSFVLPMKASQVDEVSNPRRVALVASLLLGCGVAFLGYQALASYQSYATVLDDLDAAKNKNAQLDIKYKRELAKKEKLGFNVRLVQSSIKVRNKIEGGNVKAIDMFADIGRALGKDIRIDRLVLEPAKTEKQKRNLLNRFGGQQKVALEPLYTTKIQMTYPSTTDIDRGNKEVNALSARLVKVLDGYEVKVSKLLKDYEYTEGLVVNAGDVETESDLTQDFLAEITIEGPMKEPEQ